MRPFEAHVTIDIDRSVAEWARFNRSRGFKPLRIELVEGDHPVQIMNRVRFNSFGIEEALAYASFLKNDIGRFFDVTRVKLEAPLHHHVDGDPFVYMESHLKCLLSDEGVERVVAVTPSDYGVSESMWDVPKGLRKLFVTDRVKPLLSVFNRREIVTNRFAGFYRFFEPVVSGYENEVVYLDTCPGIDAGWFEQA